MKVQIKNFQSISEAKLKLNGFSVISGNSDLGKSAVRRAITTALFNEWNKNYQRTGTDDTLVAVKLEDGTFVQAKKSSHHNEFTINGKLLPKMGRERPDIPDLNPELNVTTQLEPLFMVAYKDTENTKILNGIFGIDKLEAAQALCATDFRRNKMQLNATLEDVSALKNGITMLESSVLAYEDKVSKLTKAVNNSQLILAYRDASLKSKEQRGKAQEVEVSLNNINSHIDTLSRIDLLSSLLGIIARGQELHSTLSLARRQLNTIEANIQKLNQLQLLAQYLKLDRSVMELKVKQLKDTISVTEGQKGVINRLSLLTSYVELMKRRKALKDNIQASQDTLAQIDGELRDLHDGGVCPTCNRPLT